MHAPSVIRWGFLFSAITHGPGVFYSALQVIGACGPSCGFGWAMASLAQRGNDAQQNGNQRNGNAENGGGDVLPNGNTYQGEYQHAGSDTR